MHNNYILNLQLKGDVLEVADKIARAQRECGVKAVDPSEEINFDLMEVVYEWASATVSCLFENVFSFSFSLFIDIFEIVFFLFSKCWLFAQL